MLDVLGQCDLVIAFYNKEMQYKVILTSISHLPTIFKQRWVRI